MCSVLRIHAEAHLENKIPQIKMRPEILFVYTPLLNLI